MDSFSADMNVYVRRHNMLPYARYFVYGELLLIANGNVSIKFNGKDDNVVLESRG